MILEKKAWATLLASIDARGGARFGGKGRAGAMLEADRLLGPRTGDYGAGNSTGIEPIACLTYSGYTKLDYTDISIDQFCSPLEYRQPYPIYSFPYPPKKCYS